MKEVDPPGGGSVTMGSLSPPGMSVSIGWDSLLLPWSWSFLGGEGSQPILQPSHTIMSAALPHWWPSPALGTHALLSSSQQLCAVGTASAESRTWRGHKAVLTQVMANSCMHLIHWLKTVLWTAKNINPCFLFWERNLRINFEVTEKNLFVYLWLHFSQSKYVICKLTDGTCRVAIRC